MTISEWNNNRDRHMAELAARFAEIETGTPPPERVRVPDYPSNWRPLQNRDTREVFPNIVSAARSIGMAASSLRVCVEANIPDPRTRSYWGWFPREKFMPMRAALYRYIQRHRMPNNER